METYISLPISVNMAKECFWIILKIANTLAKNEVLKNKMLLFIKNIEINFGISCLRNKQFKNYLIFLKHLKINTSVNLIFQNIIELVNRGIMNLNKKKNANV